MKTTKTIQEFAAEIQRQQDSKRDFIINTNLVKAYSHKPEILLGDLSDNQLTGVRESKYAVNNPSRLELGFPLQADIVTAPLTLTGHDQLAEFCNIPKKYYDLVKGSSTDLLALNVEYWLKKNPAKRMIRILDDQVRAILSDRYRRLDNYDLVQHILPMLAEQNLIIDGCEITEKRLYLKARNPKVQGEVAVGDICEAGVIVQNSEIGYGSLSIKPFVYRYICKNGAISDHHSLRKYHVGRVNELEQIQFANDTLQADDKAFFLKVRDLVTQALSDKLFAEMLTQMKLSTGREIKEPEYAIELAAKKYALNQTEKSDVLKHFIEGGSLSSWGLGNAITRTAQDVESYDRSIELETIGFDAFLKNWN